MILVGDCRESLAGLPDRSVQTCVTSPPYFGLRDYGTGEWDGGDLDHEHHGTHGSGGGSSKNGAGRLGMGGREHVNGAPNRGGDPSRCPCGARRVDRQIGLEPTPNEFVAALVDVFREVRRVLRDDGTVWLNLGDSYNAYNGNRGAAAGINAVADVQRNAPERGLTWAGAKQKDLLGIPWMVAFALRADGWYLRSDIIWAKPNPMPESVTDRPTKAHEYLFLLSKGPRYFYDADAIREEGKGWSTGGPGVGIENTSERYGAGNGGNGGLAALAQRYKDAHGADGRELTATGERHAFAHPSGRNKRSVWTVATQPCAGAHFATFPPKLIEPCILAGTSPKACGDCGAPWQRVTERTPMVVRPSDRVQTRDPIEARTATSGTMTAPPMSRTVGWEPSCECVPKRERDNDWAAAVAEMDTRPCVVLDPFAGSGTVGVVCGWHGRAFVGCELNPDYAAMAEARIALEGRPGGKPAHHEPVKVIADQLGLL